MVKKAATKKAAKAAAVADTDAVVTITVTYKGETVSDEFVVRNLDGDLLKPQRNAARVVSMIRAKV